MSTLKVQKSLQHLLYIILQRITKKNNNIRKKTMTQLNDEERRGSPTNFNYKRKMTMKLNKSTTKSISNKEERRR